MSAPQFVCAQTASGPLGHGTTAVAQSDLPTISQFMFALMLRNIASDGFRDRRPLLPGSALLAGMRDRSPIVSRRSLQCHPGLCIQLGARRRGDGDGARRRQSPPDDSRARASVR